uniref:NADH:ubiquinone oxidoreductase subunit A6 n=2 Tax=Mus TaxID=862507 RepID=A0A2R8VI90_MOUSE
MAAAATGLRQAAAAAASTSVKPIFSRDLNEAKRRVRELYRAWYREVPNTGKDGAPGNHQSMEAADTRYAVFP